MEPKPTQPKLPRGKPGKKSPAKRSSKATTTEFEREGMGIAPKE